MDKLPVDGPDWVIEGDITETYLYDSNGKELAYCYRDDFISPLKVNIPD